MVTCSSLNRAWAPNTLPVLRWHARQWQIDTWAGSPDTFAVSCPHEQEATRVVVIRDGPVGVEACAVGRCQPGCGARPNLILVRTGDSWRTCLTARKHGRSGAPYSRNLSLASPHLREARMAYGPSALLQCSSVRKMSWAVCRIPARSFVYIVKAGQPALPKSRRSILVAVLTGQKTHPKRKIEPKGKITMRKAFATAHDGLMQSPEPSYDPHRHRL